MASRMRRDRCVGVFGTRKRSTVVLARGVSSTFVACLRRGRRRIRFLEVSTSMRSSLGSRITRSRGRRFRGAASDLIRVFHGRLNGRGLSIGIRGLGSRGMTSVTILSRRGEEVRRVVGVCNVNNVSTSVFKDRTALILGTGRPLIRFLMTGGSDGGTSVVYGRLCSLTVLTRGPLDPRRVATFIGEDGSVVVLLAGWWDGVVEGVFRRFLVVNDGGFDHFAVV